MNKLIAWLLMRKVKNEAGQLEVNGISVTKVCAVLIALMQAAEFVGPYFGHPINFDPKIYAFIASIGGIALKNGIDRTAAPKTSPSPVEPSSSLKP